MCKLAYVHFQPHVSGALRQAIVRRITTNSWKMGNDDGVGITTWTGEDAPVTVRSLKLATLAWPDSLGDHVLIHTRKSTNTINLANTHPLVGGGAYVVHNGIVHAGNEVSRIALSEVTHTDNDSELILKAYLGNNRKLSGALGQLSGWANVMVYDDKRHVLSVFADRSPMLMFRQNGVFIIAQASEQIVGVIQRGIGAPFEEAALPADRIFEFNTSGRMNWAQALSAAVKNAVAFQLPSGLVQTVQTRFPAAYSIRTYTGHGARTYPEAVAHADDDEEFVYSNDYQMWLSRDEMNRRKAERDAR